MAKKLIYIESVAFIYTVNDNKSRNFVTIKYLSI